MGAVGAPGVALAIAIESIFPPIPSEIVLPLAGFTASQGHYTLAEAIIWATVGSLVGALVLYGLGALVGLERLRWIADKMPLVKVSDVDKVMAWFDKYGPIAILIGRLVPGIRSLISIPAGVERMSMVQFIGFTTLGSAIWNTILILGGFFLGENYLVIANWFDTYSNIVYAVLALGILAWIAFLVVRAVRAKRAAQNATQTVHSAEPDITAHSDTLGVDPLADEDGTDSPARDY